MLRNLLALLVVVLIFLFLPVFIMWSTAGTTSIRAPHECAVIVAIRREMANLERYAEQNNGGIGRVQGTMGFADTRAYLRARDRTYRVLDGLLRVER